MADRHFDLNKALEEADGEQQIGPSWLTFDLGPNFQAPVPDPDIFVDAARLEASANGVDMDSWEPPAPPTEPGPAEPWRADRNSVGGWLVMKWMACTSTTEQYGLSMRLIRDAIDPVQWSQFESLLDDDKLPMKAIEGLVQMIVRDQLGLPLDL